MSHNRFTRFDRVGGATRPPLPPRWQWICGLLSTNSSKLPVNSCLDIYTFHSPLLPDAAKIDHANNSSRVPGGLTPLQSDSVRYRRPLFTGTDKTLFNR